MRVVLCDDHRLFAEPMAAALEMRGHEVFLCTTPAEAILAVDKCHPDVCVIDLRFPDGDGIEAVAELRNRHPSYRVVVLSASADDGDVSAAKAAGAVGFLRKDQPVSAIFEALDRIVAGGELAAPPMLRGSTGSEEHARVRRLLAQLTVRERQVLRGLLQAEDTETIARALGVATSTARTHLQNVLLKLGVRNRVQAVVLVMSVGMDSEL